MTLNGKDFILSLGQTRLTAKDCIIDSINIAYPDSEEPISVFGDKIIYEKPNQPIEIEISLKCFPIDNNGNPNFIQEFWDDNYKPRISKKLVEECSIQELLFACRNKLKD